MKVDPNRLRRELDQMRHLIRTDPNVFARFDTNGDGEIDSEEWEAVRRLVLRRLRQELHEAAAAAAVAKRREEGRPLPGELSSSGDLPRAPESAEGAVAKAVFERDVALPEPGQPADDMFFFTPDEVQDMFYFTRGFIERERSDSPLAGDRRYRVRDYLGNEVGRIDGRGGAGGATLEFDVADSLVGTSYLLRRTSSPPDSRVVILDGEGNWLATAQQEDKWIGFRVRVEWDHGELALNRKFWDSDRFDIVTDRGHAGEVERIGAADSVRGTETVRIYSRENLPVRARQGLLAASLLIDLADEGLDDAHYVRSRPGYALRRFFDALDDGEHKPQIPSF